MNVPYLANLNELTDVSPEQMVFFPGDENNKAGVIYRDLNDNYWRSPVFLKVDLIEKPIKKEKEDETKDNS